MTKKYLTRELLTETKWIRRPNTDDVTDQGGRFPHSLPSYCRSCQRQTIHDKLSEDKRGAWYYCISCREVNNQ